MTVICGGGTGASDRSLTWRLVRGVPPKTWLQGGNTAPVCHERRHGGGKWPRRRPAPMPAASTISRANGAGGTKKCRMGGRKVAYNLTLMRDRTAAHHPTSQGVTSQTIARAETQRGKEKLVPNAPRLLAPSGPTEARQKSTTAGGIRDTRPDCRQPRLAAGNHIRNMP